MKLLSTTKIKSLVALIKSHKFDWVNPNITNTIFPVQSIRNTEAKLYHFDRYISSEDAVKEMKNDGYSPANLYELLEWKDWNEKDWVIALGSVCKVFGDRRVPFLYRDGSERYLYLGYWGSGWDAGSRFLAFRNSNLEASDTQKSVPQPLDSLSLSRQEDIDKAVTFLKAASFTVVKIM